MERPRERHALLALIHRIPLYLRILIALGLGVVTGLLLGARAEPLAIPSQIILRFLGALAPALILFAVLQAIITAGP